MAKSGTGHKAERPIKTMSDAATKIVFSVLCLLAISGTAYTQRSQSKSNVRIQQPLPLWQSDVSGWSFNTLNIPLAGKVDITSGIELHHFDLACNTCHITSETNPDNNQLTFGPVNATDINSGCASMNCHEYDRVMNHPVGVFAAGPIPSSMPLSGSTITCLTCHLETGSADTAANLDSGTPSRIHVPQEADFCGSCHYRLGGGQKERAHWRASTFAHLQWITPGVNTTEKQGRSSGRVDDESRMCMSCHQNVTVSIPAPNETRAQKKARWAKTSDHSIGMDYRQTALSSGAGKEYKYPLFENGHIRFFDGKVGCGSCHSPYSKLKNNLVMSNHHDRLCLQCHDM